MAVGSQNITIIRPRKGWRAIDFVELNKYRDLLYFLSIRGIKAKYAQSVLGVGWAIIQPLVSTLIFTVIFGTIAKIDSDGKPYFIFSLTAMVPWTYFSNTLSEASNSLIANTNLINKVYFPRLILPISASLSKAVDFIVGFMLLLVFLVIYQYPVSWTVLLLPVLIVVLLMASLGCGMILAAMAVQYRDVKHGITFFLQLLMYLAPVVYPTSKIPERFRDWYALNPMVGVIEGFRSIFLGTQAFPWMWLAEGAAVSIILFVFGTIYFRRMERIFSDVI